MTDAAHPEDADRRALLEILLAEEGLVQPVAASIPRRDPDTTSVLSSAQERLWFLDQLDEQSTALTIRAAVRLRRHLDVGSLCRSLDTLLARHSSLRTTISAVEGSPRPQLLDHSSMPLVIDDLGVGTDPDDAISQLLQDEAQRLFDLERDLPIATRLLRLADDDHVISVVIHHVAADGWSFGVFFRELGELYSAFSSETVPSLDPLPIEYADYAAWQREVASGENRQLQLGFWSNQLARSPVCELPADFARPAVRTFDGGQVAASVGLGPASALRSLAAEHRATPFMVLLAAFDVVLARRTGLDDIVVGSPVAGRVRPELEGMVGMFLNTLVLRTDLSDDPSFGTLIDRVRETSVDAFDHQDVPFEDLLAELRPPRDLSRTPLFQVFFNMLNFSVDTSANLIGGLEYEVISQPDLESKFDVTLYVTDQDGRFELLLVYNRRLYRPETMRQLLDQYVQLLGSVVADPSRPISGYSLVTPEAERSLPDASTELDATWHGSVPASVRRAAERRPDHAAVVDPEGTWSYRALASQMDRVAMWLSVNGIGKGHVVAIFGHRSASTVCAVTAVLATGAAYLLLDPRHPPGRLGDYLRIANPDGWLAVGAAGPVPRDVVAALDEIGVDVRRTVPSLAELVAEASTRAGPEPDAAVLAALTDSIGPDDPACLTFTSGSTGAPKAVVGRHGSLTHFLPWQSEHYRVDADDRFSMLSGLAHDPIQRDMFWALWLGGTIVAPAPDEIATPGWLADWLRREQITVTHLTPAMGQLITETITAGRRVDPVESLRRALFIGDVLTRHDVEKFRQLAPHVEVVNLYGTTETQRASGHHVVDAASSLDGHDAVARETLPLGVGIPGTQLLVRSGGGHPAGFGEVGEVWVRSPHLALGYHDRPDETAARFHDEPGGSRTYRTGDLGRYLPNGEVEYLGRSDDQVQIRGFRVELGEINAAIARSPHVAEAVVQVRDDHSITRLVAYVVASDDHLDISHLRNTLRGLLPTHMVPTDYVVLPAIPVTANGKLDKSALPAPEHAHDATLATEPRDELERRLIDRWEHILDRTGIGIYDNFFDLGGHSLLATRLFAMIEADTGRHVAISALFEAPTVAGLADIIRGGEETSPSSCLVPVQPNGTERPFFYVAPYMISVLEFAHLGVELGENQPLWGIQPQGLDGKAPPHTTVEDMAGHYIQEIRAVQPQGPYRIGGHCSGSWVAFEMARQLEASGEQLETLALVDLGPPDVERPLMTVRRYVLGRIRFYFSDGRIRHAVAWKFKNGVKALVLRRVGPSTLKYAEEVRAAHRTAYRAYKGGMIRSDITLIRSDDSLKLADKDWFLRWDDKTTGVFRHTRSRGTHANLLERPYVEMLADRLRSAFERRELDRPEPVPERSQ